MTWESLKSLFSWPKENLIGSCGPLQMLICTFYYPIISYLLEIACLAALLSLPDNSTSYESHALRPKGTVVHYSWDMLIKINQIVVIYLFRFNITVRLLLIGHIVTTLLSISLTSRLSQPSSSRHEYCNFTCLSPDMPDFHVACLRVFILPPWIPFQVQPPAFYTLVAEFEARGFESTPTSESGYRTRVLWESSICDVMSVDLALHSTHWAIGALYT